MSPRRLCVVKELQRRESEEGGGESVSDKSFFSSPQRFRFKNVEDDIELHQARAARDEGGQRARAVRAEGS